MSEPAIIARYRQTVAEKSFREDAAQLHAAEAFQVLYDQLVDAESPRKKRLFSVVRPTPKAAGLYVWGDVGRGKSMLMDLFVDEIKQLCPTRRVHFHAFMRDVHQRMFAYRQHHEGEVIEHVIRDIAREARLLCLDELQVTDVADAMILARLFAGLMDAGVSIVFTSNRPPRQLYQGGLQREQFLKFVTLLEARMPMVEVNGAQDYRLAQMKALSRTYMFPRNSDSDDFLLTSWNMLTGGAASEPMRITVDGRILRVDKQVHGVAWLTFAELCLRPLGASDYLELATLFHTILLQGIPCLTPEDRNEAKRLATLIDTLYDCRVKLIATAETAPKEIYASGDGTFEFGRTVSRLIEMQSEAYLALPHAAFHSKSA